MKKIFIAFSIILSCINGAIVNANINDNVPEWVEQTFCDLIARGVIAIDSSDCCRVQELSRIDKAMLLAKKLDKTSEQERLDKSDIKRFAAYGIKIDELKNLENVKRNDESRRNELELIYNKKINTIKILKDKILVLENDLDNKHLIKQYDKNLKYLISETNVIADNIAELDQTIAKHTIKIEDLQLHYAKNVKKITDSTITPSDITKIQLEQLKIEFAPELRVIGYVPAELLQLTNSKIEEKNYNYQLLNVSGQIRYNYVANSAATKYSFTDSKVRARIYFDAALSPLLNSESNSWYLHSMLEYQKSFLQDTKRKNSIDSSRLYIDGKTGITKVTAGTFGYILAEGNIYDSSFTGLRAEIEDNSLVYDFGYGHADAISKGYIASVRYDNYDYRLGAGVYRLEDNNRRLNTISTISGTYLFDTFDLGVMYLHSSSSFGNQKGYVYTINKGKVKTWVPGTYNLFLKYYNQPSNTYVAHTMLGVGTRMNGFKGYGIGGYYTLISDLVLGLEYYDLVDKETSDRGRTLWGQVTYYF